MAVRFEVVQSRAILNLTSPRRFRDIAQHWKGKRDWHDPLYEPVRDIMERMYVAGFDGFCGHYRKLEESIIAQGVLNPVMLITGRLLHRQPSEIPPALRDDPHLPVSEYLGGSRLYIAQRLDLPVPAIINDFGNAFPGARELMSRDDVLACFADKPARISFNADGVHVGGLSYSHLEGVTSAHQSRFRKGLVADIRRAVAVWLKEHDREYEHDHGHDVQMV